MCAYSSPGIPALRNDTGDANCKPKFLIEFSIISCGMQGDTFDMTIRLVGETRRRTFSVMFCTLIVELEFKKSSTSLELVR